MIYDLGFLNQSMERSARSHWKRTKSHVIQVPAHPKMVHLTGQHDKIIAQTNEAHDLLASGDKMHTAILTHLRISPALGHHITIHGFEDLYIRCNESSTQKLAKTLLSYTTNQITCLYIV